MSQSGSNELTDDDADPWENGTSEEEDALVEIRREAELILGKVPPESKTPELVVDTVLKVVQTHRMYSGPHPSPTMLAELKEVDPSLPNRAMTFAEKEQSFRHEMSREMSRGELAVAHRAQWLAFLGRAIGQLLAVGVVLGIVGVVAFLIHHDKDVKAFTPIIYALSALSVTIIAAKVVKQKWFSKDADEASDSDDESA